MGVADVVCAPNPCAFRTSEMILDTDSYMRRSASSQPLKLPGFDRPLARLMAESTIASARSVLFLSVPTMLSLKLLIFRWISSSAAAAGVALRVGVDFIVAAWAAGAGETEVVFCLAPCIFLIIVCNPVIRAFSTDSNPCTEGWAGSPFTLCTAVSMIWAACLVC